MESKTALIGTIVVLVTGIVFMAASWVRFARIESTLTEHETKIYVIDLVQTELMAEQGLHVEVTGAESAVGGWHSPTSGTPAIKVNDQNSDELSEERPAKKKHKRGGK